MNDADTPPRPDADTEPRTPATRPQWLAMRAEQFETRPRLVQGSLFPLPDPYGTGDLADLLEE